MSIKVIKKPINWHGLIIPGGWECKIPEIRLIPEDEAKYIHFWVRQGMRQKEALAKVIKDHQVLYTTRFHMMIRQVVGKGADEFRRRWPRLDISVYDPAIISRIYVPGRPQFDANPLYSQALVAMVEEREDETTRRDEEDQG